MNTKERIIQSSIALFNEHGERAITTNHIAAHLGMSPGNLYYHFKNKNDIIRHIFAGYATHLAESFTPIEEGQSTLTQLEGYLDGLASLMSRYHFFYDNLGDILGRDATLKEQYITMQTRLFEQVYSVIEGMHHADIIEVAQEDITQLVHMLKLMVSAWTPYIKSQTSEGVISQEAVYQGIVNVVMLFKPYGTARGKMELSLLQSRYQALSTPSPEQEQPA